MKHVIAVLIFLIPSTLFADDTLPCMAFRSFRHEEKYNRQFAEIGVKTVFIYPANTLCSLGIPYTQYPPNWLGIGKYDWDALDRQIEDILKWNEGAKLIVMIDLNTPPWWIKSHKGADSFRNLGHVVAREDYRADVSRYLKDFLAHTEEKYADVIAAYMLSGGMTCEWQDMTRGTPSPSKQAAFAKWLGKPDAVIPKDVAKASASPFFDPQKDAAKIAYWRFSADLVGRRICDFAATSQAIVKHRVPIGCFYGYVFEHARNRLLYESHLSYPLLFADDNLQMFTSPASYAHRKADGTSGFMTCVDSILARDKAVWLELDHITHLLKDGSENGRPIPGHDSAFRTEDETVHSLRRAFGMCLAKGAHVWWFDMFGGWFDSPKIMAEIRRMREIADAYFRKGKSVAEILVLADPDSMYYVEPTSTLAAVALSPQRAALGRVGAPHEIYSFEDLKRLDTSRFKMVLLPNLFAVTPEKRELLEEKIFRDGKTVIFCYAPGVITDGEYDLGGIEKLTGIAVKNLPKIGAPREVKTRKMDGWTSVYVSQPNIPSRILWKFAKEAKVHVYDDQPDTLYANDRLIAIHSLLGGERTFKLKVPAKVTELYSKRVIASKPVWTFTDTLVPMKATLYALEPAEGEIRYDSW